MTYGGFWGWSSSYPQSALTVSSTASRLGLDNRPSSSTHAQNLSILSDFLARIPFALTVTSAYRSPAVNAAVGGSATSQHPNGLAADVVPSGMSNRELATWLYDNRGQFPELDQVIWYEDTNHVHIGICPPEGVGCPGPRGQFLQARKEGSAYSAWMPEIVVQAATQTFQAATASAGTVMRVHRRRPWVVPLVFGASGLVVAVAVLLLGRRR